MLLYIRLLGLIQFLKLNFMNNRNIEKLQEIIIRNLVPKINEDYALLDIPNHCNIGDNLIWEGELNF